MRGMEYNHEFKSFNNSWFISNKRGMNHDHRNNTEYIQYCIFSPKNRIVKNNNIYTLPAAWNTPGDLRYHHNKTTFKIALKDELFEEIG
jgi:hypothetical protein